MKPSSAANTSIGLVLVGWLVATYGVLRQLGDAAPWVSKAELETHREISTAFVLIGSLALLGALWLSGYCFKSAPKRAMLAAFTCVAPAVALFVAAFIFNEIR